MRSDLRLALLMADAAAGAAVETLRAIARFRLEKPRPRNASLRAGADTPLWNEVVRAAEPFLKKRGEKSKLARILGVPRQRVHDYFVAKTAVPDAERTLVILTWLSARRSGKDLG